MDQLDYYVVFGAAVRPGGLPSGTLSRRVLGALASARANTNEGRERFLLTGGIGEHGPSEAEVMARLLRAEGVPDERIVLEPESKDTLESVARCSEILVARGDAARVHVCTSPYHSLRCALLFRILGVRARVAAMPGDRGALGLWTWSYYWARDLIAIPYDALLALTIRLRRSRVKAGEKSSRE